MNTKKEKSKAAFDQQAATYDHDFKGSHARALYPVMLKKLSQIPFQSALDLGCGTGEIMKLILQADPHKELYGIDLSEKMLAVARSKLPNQVKLLSGDSESLPFPDHSFDVVYCNDSFHHYPAPQNVLREVRRVLKPGGKFLIGDCWLPLISRVIMNAFMRYSKEGDVKIYSKAEMVLMLSECFREVSWEQVGNTACIAMGRK